MRTILAILLLASASFASWITPTPGSTKLTSPFKTLVNFANAVCVTSIEQRVSVNALNPFNDPVYAANAIVAMNDSNYAVRVRLDVASCTAVASNMFVWAIANPSIWEVLRDLLDNEYHIDMLQLRTNFAQSITNIAIFTAQLISQTVESAATTIANSTNGIREWTSNTFYLNTNPSGFLALADTNTLKAVFLVKKDDLTIPGRITSSNTIVVVNANSRTEMAQSYLRFSDTNAAAYWRWFVFTNQMLQLMSGATPDALCSLYIADPTTNCQPVTLGYLIAFTNAFTLNPPYDTWYYLSNNPKLYVDRTVTNGLISFTEAAAQNVADLISPTSLLWQAVQDATNKVTLRFDGATNALRESLRAATNNMRMQFNGATNALTWMITWSTNDLWKALNSGTNANNYVKKTGDVMTGDLTISNHGNASRIRLYDSANATPDPGVEAADTLNIYPCAGDPIIIDAATINFGGRIASGFNNPLLTNDAATKKYVDDNGIVSRFTQNLLDAETFGYYANGADYATNHFHIITGADNNSYLHSTSYDERQKVATIRTESYTENTYPKRFVLTNETDGIYVPMSGADPVGPHDFVTKALHEQLPFTVKIATNGLDAGTLSEDSTFSLTQDSELRTDLYVAVTVTYTGEKYAGSCDVLWGCVVNESDVITFYDGHVVYGALPTEFTATTLTPTFIAGEGFTTISTGHIVKNSESAAFTADLFCVTPCPNGPDTFITSFLLCYQNQWHRFPINILMWHEEE